MKLTGAAILVSRGMKVLQAAPAAYPYRSATEDAGVENAAALRQALADFLGAERFRKFVRQLRGAGRLRFWQEQEWGRFVAIRPDFAASGNDLVIALRVCW